ncbi:MAG: hypothetical protein IH614_05465, partial [Desulfuromonadales bacterium]|nr:hypothetical protein [Desulfuromonadales bacterium]
MKRMMVAAALGVWIVAAAFAVQAQMLPLEAAEQQAMNDTVQYALENNRTEQAADWVNPDTGRAGAVVPVRTFHDPQGLPCREFLTVITIGGREEQGYGTACRQPDGDWQIVAPERQLLTSVPVPAQNIYLLSTPPPVYYRYPEGFYGSYPIFLSFSYVYRSGHLHRGHHYLSGRDFRHRYPLGVRERVFVGPRIYHYHQRFDDRRGRGKYEG